MLQQEFQITFKNSKFGGQILEGRMKNFYSGFITWLVPNAK